MGRRALKINPGRKLGFMPMPADIARMLSRVVVVQRLFLPNGVTGECWEWQGTPDPQGYGSIKIGPRKYWVHRVSFAVFHHDSAEGMQVDHLCLNRCCINPAHLVAKSHGQNAAEANTRRWAAYRAAKQAQRADDEEPPHTPLNGGGGTLRGTTVLSAPFEFVGGLHG